ncbi:MAG: NUDIX domain-containing protein [Pirellulales bacterium]
MERTLEAAGLLLIVRQSQPQFLLMRHADRWDLPKGHAEEGEDTLTTALRETEEETGISSTEITVEPDFRFHIEYEVIGKKRGNYHKRVTYYLGFLKSKPEIRATEHAGHEWWDWPPSGPIQTQTIDPLLNALQNFLTSKPDVLTPKS